MKRSQKVRILKAALLATAVLAVAGRAMAFGPANQHDIGSDGYDTSDLRGAKVVDVQCFPSIEYRRIATRSCTPISIWCSNRIAIC